MGALERCKGHFDSTVCMSQQTCVSRMLYVFCGSMSASCCFLYLGLLMTRQSKSILQYRQSLHMMTSEANAMFDFQIVTGKQTQQTELIYRKGKAVHNHLKGIQ